MRIRVAEKFFALVALLAAAGLSQAQVVGTAEAGAGKTAVCVACHGQDGNDSVLPNAPKLGGQNEKYLIKQLEQIKTGERVVPEMTGLLNPFNEQDLADMAAYYASQEIPVGAADPAIADLGASIYRAGIAEIGVAACSACHSPTGSGNALAAYPMLKGQLPAYTEKQLRDFRAGVRNNDEAEVMRSLAKRLSDEEIAAIASYVFGLR